MSNIVIIGAPGSGKGTLSDKIKAEKGAHHLIASSLIRELAYAESTPEALKQEGQLALEKGVLVSDGYITELFKIKLSQIKDDRPIIFDGYPRTIGQADDLMNMTEIGQVIVLDVDESLVRKRLAGRLTCPDCKSTFHQEFMPPEEPGMCNHCQTPLTQRSDDCDTKTVEYRLNSHQEKTVPIIQHFRVKLGDRKVKHIVVNEGDSVDHIYNTWDSLYSNELN